MDNLGEIKTEITDMSKASLKMLQTTYQAFMEHERDLITLALDEENKLNALEKKITIELIELARSCVGKQEKMKATIYVDVVGDLELIGDYCKDILERVQIKIEEKLLFSEDALKEYNELYQITENALKEVVEALEKEDLSLVNEVLKKEEHIDGLVDVYRLRHNQRLLDGVCSPMACNMFLNMLDFTAAIYYHIKKISRSLIKIKK